MTVLLTLFVMDVVRDCTE